MSGQSQLETREDTQDEDCPYKRKDWRKYEARGN